MCAPKGIRIPVAALKGRCPRPLDDGGKDLPIVSEMHRPVKSKDQHQPRPDPGKPFLSFDAHISLRYNPHQEPKSDS